MAKIIISGPNEYWKESKLQPSKNVAESTIRINASQKDQKIFGFGGAFTDAATVTFYSLTKEKQDEYLKAYFSKEGLNYSLGRYPIQSTDFSENTYYYLKDKTIDSFDMSCDKKRMKFVKRAMELKQDLWLCAVPWSPCPFMKNNNDMCHGGKLLPEYYDLWAQTITKTVKELKKNGITIKCVSTQNEPAATQTWESCVYTAAEEADFLKNYLIPASKREKMNDLKFFIWDHNRDLMFERTKEILACGVPIEDVFGVAYHWYDRTCFTELKKTHDKYPNLHILLTECCVELLCDDNSGIGSWINGLRYGINIIKDLNNGSEGYIDWNLSLNLQGGPNHVGNFCEAPLLIDPAHDQIKYMPSYYVIGHFSKYLDPGDERIETVGNDDGDLLITAFENKKGEIKVVIINNSQTKKNICISIKNNYFFEIESKHIVTIID